MGRYVPDWRHVYVLCSIIVVPFLLLWFVPETPYYLINKDLKKRCKAVLLGFAKKNGVKTDEKELEKVIQNIPVETDTENLSPKLLFTYSKELTWITARLCFLIFAITFAMTGTGLFVTKLPGNQYVNAALSGVVDFIASATWPILASWDQLGRKWTTLGNLVFSSVCLLCALICDQFTGCTDDYVSTLVTVFSLLAKFGCSLNFCVIYQWISEIYPTSIRSSGVGICSASSIIAAILTPAVLALYGVYSWLPNIIFAVLGLLAVVLGTKLPETNGVKTMQTLKEAQEFYEGPVKIGAANIAYQE